jgi:triosephosphate isomerase (TIM)
VERNKVAFAPCDTIGGMNTTPKRQRIVAGNWKMNPTTKSEAERLIRSMVKKLSRPKATVVIAPPTLYTDVVKKSLGKKYQLGAQNAHEKENGPYTGNISARMLFGSGVRYVILGHSERRKEGESNEQVREKVQSILAAKLVPIVCVGERERDHQARYFSFVEAQVRTALSGTKKADMKHVIIAYEPVWAISSGDGKGKTATPDDAHEMKLFIQKVLAELFGRAVGLSVPILYGGSVNEGNAKELMTRAQVDGFLVGGASLKTDAFITIIKEVERA